MLEVLVHCSLLRSSVLPAHGSKSTLSTRRLSMQGLVEISITLVVLLFQSSRSHCSKSFPRSFVLEKGGMICRGQQRQTINQRPTRQLRRNNFNNRSSCQQDNASSYSNTARQQKKTEWLRGKKKFEASRTPSDRREKKGGGMASASSRQPISAANSQVGRNALR